MEYFKQRRLRRLTHLVFGLYHIPLLIFHRFGWLPQSAFRVPWAKHLPWFFRGYTPEGTGEIWDWIAEEFLADHWRMDTRALLEEHRRVGDLVVLVSAGPLPLIQRLAQVLGAHHAVGTQPRVRQGRFTGGVSGLVSIGKNKPILLQDLLSRLQIDVDFENSHAYADSLGDVPLLEMVGNPVAVYPDEELRPVAINRGWQIFPEKEKAT